VVCAYRTNSFQYPFFQMISRGSRLGIELRLLFALRTASEGRPYNCLHSYTRLGSNRRFVVQFDDRHFVGNPLEFTHFCGLSGLGCISDQAMSNKLV